MELGRISRKNIDKQKIFVFSGFFILVVFNLWKAKYGMVWIDEAAYLGIPFRMMQGDSLLVHEWHLSQMSAFLIYPLYRIYMLVFNSTEGVYLAFRYIYAVAHCFMSFFIYKKLKRFSIYGALVAALWYGVFTFSGLMTLCYNTMGIGLLLFACLSIVLQDNAANTTSKNFVYIIAGLAFAGAVLCCPFLLIIYGLYTLAAFVCAVAKLGDTLAGRILCLRTWLMFTLGCVVLAVLFFLHIAMKGGLDRMLETLPYILTDDTHAIEGPIDWLKGFYNAFYRYNRFFLPVLIGSVVLFTLIVLDRGRNKRRGLYFAIAASLALIFSLPYVLTYRSENYQIFPMSILGFFAWLLCSRKNHQLFWGCWIPGAIYWACIDMASNMGIASICGASAVNLPANVIFIAQLLSEIKQDQHKTKPLCIINQVSALAGCAVVLVFAGSLMLLRVELALYDTALKDATAVCTVGAAKGLVDSPELVSAYEKEYAELAQLRSLSDGNVLYYSNNCIRYLEDKKGCSTSEMWLGRNVMKRGIGRLEDYWEIFPEKYPQYVYIPYDSKSDEYLNDFSGKYIHLEELETGVILYMEKQE